VRLRHDDRPAAFLEAASPLLLRDEARHNLIFGICATLIETPDAYPAFHSWVVVDAGAIAAAAVMTPPFNLALAEPRRPDALAFLASELHRQGIPIPGVTGALPEAEAFADTWERLSGTARRIRMGQGIYAVRAIRLPRDVPGGMRAATQQDRDLVLEWWRAFMAESLPPGAPHGDVESNVDRRLISTESGIVLWEHDRPVSVAGFGGSTPHGKRIGPVYTPPELRRRGYASALVARLSEHLLTAFGLEYCFLYTDLANPTANRIYLNVGYEFVAESADYAFDH
jgi:predicted GNAT family acetyltransferase